MAQLAAIGMVAAGLAGCQSDFQRTMNATDQRVEAIISAKLQGQFSVSVVPDTKVLRYSWSGVDYDSQTEVLAAVSKSYAEEINTIVPVTERLGGKIHVVIPTLAADVAASSGGNNEQGAETFAAYDRLFDQTRIDALRRANLFDELTQEEADTPVSPAAETYLLVRTGNSWHLSYANSPALPLTWSGLGLYDWVVVVQKTAVVAKEAAPKEDQAPAPAPAAEPPAAP
jgi:hypothetical protein